MFIIFMKEILAHMINNYTISDTKWATENKYPGKLDRHIAFLSVQNTTATLTSHIKMDGVVEESSLMPHPKQSGSFRR